MPKTTLRLTALYKCFLSLSSGTGMPLISHIFEVSSSSACLFLLGIWQWRCHRHTTGKDGGISTLFLITEKEISFLYVVTFRKVNKHSMQTHVNRSTCSPCSIWTGLPNSHVTFATFWS